MERGAILGFLSQTSDWLNIRMVREAIADIGYVNNSLAASGVTLYRTFLLIILS